MKPGSSGLVSVSAGIPLASIVAPASTFMFGDTQSVPFYTISIDNWMEINGTTNSALVHSGMFNLAYCDGHAKNMGWRAGDTNVIPGRLIVVPRNASDQGKWCIDPAANIGSPVGTMPCGQVVPAIIAKGVIWFSD